MTEEQQFLANTILEVYDIEDEMTDLICPDADEVYTEFCEIYMNLVEEAAEEFYDDGDIDITDERVALMDLEGMPNFEDMLDLLDMFGLPYMLRGRLYGYVQLKFFK